MLASCQDGAAHNPFTGGSANERRPQGRRLTELLTPGTEPNRRWMRQLDDVATALTELQAAGVVVLWRLFPEFNGDWFWWGAAADGQDYIALWRQTHDYLTTTRHLSNLIWVWAGSRESGPWMQPLAKYYPGAAYVDVVGLDVYIDVLDQASVKAYRDLTALGKPFVLAEYGPDNRTTTPRGALDLTTLIPQLKRLMPRTVYFKFFSDYIVPQGYTGPAHNMYWSILSNQRGGELLRDPWVVNADQVPAFGRGTRAAQP